MSFRVLFWNIENFTDVSEDRVKLVADHIVETNPDVVGFSEIKDKSALRNMLFDRLGDYDFGITDGDQKIEIVAGWRRNLFEQALFTQRREFKVNRPGLRPGSLLSLKKNGIFYNMLFLHTDSGRGRFDYENRQDMFSSVWSLRRRLDQIEEAGQFETRFLVLGDLNTMGRGRSGRFSEVGGSEEISELDRDANDNGMNLLGKSDEETFIKVDGGEKKYTSNLDHVIVADPIRLGDAGGGEKVRVRGWVESDAVDDQIEFALQVSDHASIEVLILEPGD